MKRFLSILLASVLFGACAGNPPAWWNPNNRYGQTEKTAPAPSTPAQPSKPAEPVVTDVELDPLPDNSYEEEVISPLPEEEDMPSTTPAAEPSLDEALPAPSILE